MFPDLPELKEHEIMSFKDFAKSVQVQTQFLLENGRIDLIQEQYELSQKNKDLQSYKKEIEDLKASIKSRDQRIDADARILR